jgi:hypothetical protein
LPPSPDPCPRDRHPLLGVEVAQEALELAAWLRRRIATPTELSARGRGFNSLCVGKTWQQKAKEIR